MEHEAMAPMRDSALRPQNISGLNHAQGSQEAPPVAWLSMKRVGVLLVFLTGCEVAVVYLMPL